MYDSAYEVMCSNTRTFKWTYLRINKCHFH